MPSPPPKTLASVLLIEDDDDIREIVAEVLSHRGYAVATARNGRAGIEELEASVVLPDVILLDLMMPDMNGREFLAAVKARPRCAGVPVVVMTASGRAQPEVGFETIAGWLSKPVDRDVLLATVARFAPGTHGVSG